MRCSLLLYNFIFNDETMTLPLLRNKRKILIIFGRPGAGKSTIAAVSYAKLLEDKRRENEAICTYLDLDDCVPQWMKDNFSKGLYFFMFYCSSFLRCAISIRLPRVPGLIFVFY